jgi:hypothetical protein
MQFVETESRQSVGVRLFDASVQAHAVQIEFECFRLRFLLAAPVHERIGVGLYLCTQCFQLALAERAGRKQRACAQFAVKLRIVDRSTHTGFE